MDPRHQQNQHQSQHLQDAKIFAQVPIAPCLQAAYGGCNGYSKEYFDANCKKSCGLCGDGSTAPAEPAPEPASAGCEDLCPGTDCTMSPDSLCGNPGNFGGCDGIYSAYFEQYCKKTCNKC